MNDLRRAFPRAELADTAERWLADRRAGDPEAVRRNLYTPERAHRREACARAVAETLRAVAERRDPGDAEQRWFDSGGAQAAPWSEIRADLAATIEAARAVPALEAFALRLAAIASWFEPATRGGITPAILLAAHVEQQLRAMATAARQAKAAAPVPPRRREMRPSGLFAASR